MPVWIPSRPLLPGYLAARGLLNETNAIDVNMSPAGAWDKPLDLIYRREEGMDARIEAQSVRKSSNSLRQSLALRKSNLVSFQPMHRIADLTPAAWAARQKITEKRCQNPSRVSLYLVRRTPLIQRGIKACIVMDVTKTGKHKRSNKSKHACIC